MSDYKHLLAAIDFSDETDQVLPLSNIYLRPILVGLIISILLEFIQVFSTTRFPGILDVMCNLIGTILGSIILHFGWTLIERNRLLKAS